MEGLMTNQPSVRHVKSFDGEVCAVPLRISHYWIQTLFSAHALATYDISDLAHIREVSRVTFDEKQTPHWIATDEGGRRIVLNSGEYGDHRLFIVSFDPQTGALTLDGRFRDAGSERAGCEHGWQVLAARISGGCLSARGSVFRVLLLRYGTPRQQTRLP